MTLDLKGVMQQAADHHSPDLHFQVGQPPVIRLRSGALSTLKKAPVLTIMQINANEGIRLMDDSLEMLVHQNIISADEAVSHASDSQALYQKLS